MQTRPLPLTLRTLSLSLTVLALPAAAAPTVYEMRLMTHSGMGAGGMGGIMSMLSGGGGGSSVSHNMDLRLISPSDLPAFVAAHRDLAGRVETSGETAFFYCSDPRPLLARLAEAPGLRYVHRASNLEDVFIKLTGRELRD